MGPSIRDAQARLGWDDNWERTPPGLERCAFSLTLKAFNLPPHPTPVIPDVQRQGIHPPIVRDAKPVDGSSDGLSSIEDDGVGQARSSIESRLDALIDVFENTEHYIMRMARHLARRNIKLKRRATTRPSGAGSTRWVDALMQVLQSCALAVAPPVSCPTIAAHDTS